MSLMDLNKVPISEVVKQQRLIAAKDIKNLHKEIKSFFHISEYKLIKGLVDGLENTLMLEYMIYIETAEDKNVKQYDFWAYDKIIAIYRKSI